MATPASQPTRQQLDDLDALLQRMLSLPGDPAEEPVARESPPSPPLYPGTLTAPAGNVILSDPELPTPQPPTPYPAEPRPLPLLNPVPPTERRGPILPMPDHPRTALEALAASRPPQPSLLLRPILGLNRLFDAVAFSFGAPGRWLGRPAGRTLLGLIGLLLLAAAGALVLLDRIGWTW